MIPTLGNGPLFLVNRDKIHMREQFERRKAFWLFTGIIACMIFNVVLWIVYR